MALVVDSPYELDLRPEEPVTQTEPRLQRDGRRSRFPWRRTAVGASPYHDELVVENHSPYTWVLWLRFHELGAIPPGSEMSFDLDKSGLLVARQFPAPAHAEHLMLDLQPTYSRIAIHDTSGGWGFYAFHITGMVHLDVPQLDTGDPIPDDTPIEDLNLTAAFENVLKSEGISLVRQLREEGVRGIAGLQQLPVSERMKLMRHLRKLGIV